MSVDYVYSCRIYICNLMRYDLFYVNIIAKQGVEAQLDYYCARE